MSSSEPKALISMGAEPVVHLPIDPILKRLQRVKSFVLGVGSIGGDDFSLKQSIVRSLVSRCSEKTERKAILVSIEPTNRLNLNDVEIGAKAANDGYQTAVWTALSDDKSDSKSWHTQLGDLPRWKQEFGLIVFDLGNVASPQMLRVGRLCDGIVVQLHNPNDSRVTIQAMKSLTQENLPILGAWSVGLSYQKLAG